jgi:nicotinamide-nucleotide amidase
MSCHYPFQWCAHYNAFLIGKCNSMNHGLKEIPFSISFPFSEQYLVHCVSLLQAQHIRLVVVESCTGGLLAAILTAIPGSSAWFEGGWVSYANESKKQWLSINEKILTEEGAVSQSCAIAMATNGLNQAISANYCIAITGYASPANPDDTLCGTIWLAIASHFFPAKTQLCRFLGNRQEIQTQAVQAALSFLMNILPNSTL